MSNEPRLTDLLQAWSEGDAESLAALVPLVHQELRDMARHLLANERRHAEWRPTELVQESYLRLLDWRAVRWQNRAHFTDAGAVKILDRHRQARAGRERRRSRPS